MTEALVPTLHSRALRTNRYVYVVRSRRSGGVSVGINLDPQKTCNFDCVYCEVVDRKAIARKTGRPPVETRDVIDELARDLDALAAGHEAVKDIAFAGDGEPSTFPGFFDLSLRVFDLRDARSLLVPVVLITNGSGLDREEMRRAHDLFFERGGVFWIKLDAGTEAFYRRVCRTAVPFEAILKNLLDAARRHPVVVQSLFFRWNGEAPPEEEIEAWAKRLADVVRGGGEISLVQVYTVARDTMEPGIEPLTKDELESIAHVARRESPQLIVDTFV